MTPEQMDETIRSLIDSYIDVSSQLGSLKVEVQALREVLSANAPNAVAGYDERFDALMMAFVEHLESIVERGKETAVQLRMRRLLEAYSGPKQ
jgi:hypothetical protein